MARTPVDAFFDAPGIDRYSRVTKSAASVPADRVFQCKGFGGEADVVVRAVERQVADPDLAELKIRRRQIDQNAREFVVIDVEERLRTRNLVAGESVGRIGVSPVPVVVLRF